MLDHLTHRLTLDNHRPDLLGHHQFLAIALFTSTLITPIWRHHHVYTAALTREDLGTQALAAQIDRCTIHLIEQYGRHNAIDLNGEFGRLDHVDTRYKRVHQDGKGGAIIDADGCGFANDFDNSLVAASYEDRMVDFGIDLHNFVACVVIVFDEPFVAVEFFLWRLLRLESVWFPVGHGRLASGGRGGLGGGALGYSARGA